MNEETKHPNTPNATTEQDKGRCALAPGSTFPLGVVLSATTGRLLCEMGKIYGIMNHVTGDNLYTHALPRAFRFAAPLIKAQYPELETAETPESMARLDALIADAKARNRLPMVGCEAWLATCGLAREYAIQSHADAWLSRNPIEEAEAMVGKYKVVVVDTSNPAYDNP